MSEDTATASRSVSPDSAAAPIVIVGAGLAGVTVALRLADRYPVVLLAKRSFEEAGTAWAQGGIVGVLGDDDSVALHVRDTQDAGAGLVDEHAAEFIAQRSREAIQWLVEQGVPFTTDPTGPLGLHLTREGGHAVRRIAHAADATGRAILEVLIARARQHPNITMRERWMAVDLVTSRHLGRAETPRCYGVYALDLDGGHVETLPAAAVVIATGGVGKVYRYTTNPETSTGDGIAMAWRAGCRVGNMEFIQFHPTCLYHPQERSFLISEALRGEGAYLTLPDGTRFMAAHDPRLELAPRDIVARAIDFEMKKHGLDHVWLDARHLGEAFLLEHFPTIRARCLELGIDIARQPIPVVPAAHYTCGGVVTDLDGRTDLPGLYAVGGDLRPYGPARRQPAGQQLAARVRRHRPVLCRPHRERAAGRGGGAAGLGREPGGGRRRAGCHLAQLGRAAAGDVELRRHRADHETARPRAAQDPPPAGGDRRLLRLLPRHPRPAGAAQPRGLRGARGAVRAGAPREPWPALQPRLSSSRSRPASRRS